LIDWKFICGNNSLRRRGAAREHYDALSYDAAVSSIGYNVFWDWCTVYGQV